MNLKKIVIFLVIIVLTGCGISESKQSENKTPKNKEKSVTISNGNMETINSKGFKIDLEKNGDNAIIVIQNDKVKKDQAYQIDFTIHQKEGNSTVQEAYIPANMPEPLRLNTNLKSNDVTNIEYKITETESILKGSNGN